MPLTDSPKFPLVWELDSILPHPESAEFRAVLNDYRTRLTQLADETDGLPPLQAEPQNISAWKRLLAEYAVVESLASDLSSFAGCHAAADAANSLYSMTNVFTIDFTGISSWSAVFAATVTLAGS